MERHPSRAASELESYGALVSERKRSGRSGGHPAKVAARRARGQARRSRDSDLDRIGSLIHAAASTLASPVQAERWASFLLGTLWRLRLTLPGDQAALADYTLTLGAPMIDRLARQGGWPAAVALRAVAALDKGELGLRSMVHAEALTRVGVELPAWAFEVGKAGVVAAALMHEDIHRDAYTLFLEARHPGGATHAIGVFVDNNLGAMSTDAVEMQDIAEFEHFLETARDDGFVPKLEWIEPLEAAARIRAAIELTDMALNPPVAKTYAELRALALLRADGASTTESAPRRPELGARERERPLEGVGALRRP
jgi:hypothetical protein